MAIPYVRDFEFSYGEPQQISPHVRRLVAHNPGPFTAWGTNVYLVGKTELVIIDPGPDTDQHFQVLTKAIGSAKVTAVFVTHHHMDHSPMAPRLAAHFGCQTYGFGRPSGHKVSDTDKMEAGVDRRFQPDNRLTDQQEITYENWQIKCIHTPGHTSNHMCYLVGPDNGLICGDHVMGWATSVVLPPDGSMAHYLQSLAKIKEMQVDHLWPGHGPAVDQPDPFLQAYIEHRAMRDKQILNCLHSGKTRIKDMVKIMYADVDPKLYPAAGYSVLSHLIRLQKIGQIHCAGAPQLKSRFRLTG